MRLRRQLVDLSGALKVQLAQVDDRAARRVADEALADLARRIARIDTLIARRIAASADLARRAALLRSIPGVGKIASATLLARMPELGTLTPKAAAALLGVAPWDRQSGAGDRRRSIHGGRGDVRKVIYMSALVAPKSHPDLKAFKQRLLNAGKPFKVVNVAIMNKIIRIANAVLERGTPFAIKQ